MGEITKVTVNLPTKLVNQIRVLADDRGTTMTETIRKGLEMDLYLSKAASEGGRILLQRGNDRITELVRR